MGKPEISFDVFGEPAPQGSKTIMRGRLVEASSKKLKPWRKAVTLAAMTHLEDSGVAFLDDAVEITVKFYVRRGTTVKRLLPTVPSDLDKLIRAVNDSLTDAQVWNDDSQVVKLTAFKVYADNREPGAFIQIAKYNG
tara:strand:- start:1265 stop:1675 length:411 start_codon:yes stop_codon:yes gene_type:complete